MQRNIKYQSSQDPDPKKGKQKDVETESESTDIVNEQSQTQVTNDSDISAMDTNESTVSEEEKDEKLNNLRDALNSDNMPLPDDERDNDIVN